MSEMLRRMMLTAGTALCLALFVSGCEQKTTEPKAPKPLVVTTVKTTAADEPKWRMFNGRTESGDAVEVRAQVSGVLTEVLFSEGSRVKKGDVLTVAQVAGIMGAKRTPDLIPMCHPILLTGVDLELTLNEKDLAVEITATTRCNGVTGVEMEALTAVSAAALTVYDMCKAVQRDMVIDNIRLLRKSGGQSGDFLRKED